MLSNQPFHWRPHTCHDQAVLLLHGLGGGVYEMSLLGKYLHENKGCAVVGINYPGHDEPADRMPASTWQAWYRHVEETYRELAAAYDKVTVVGFSTGCLLGLHLATQYPVAHLILLSPFLKVKHEWFYILRPEVYVRSLSRIIKDVPRRRLPIKDMDMMPMATEAAFFKTFNIPSVKSALELIESVTGELAHIQTPTLIIQSNGDSVVCPTGAEFLMQALGSPRKEVYWLTESDHIICLDVERETVMQKVLEFLQDDG